MNDNEYLLPGASQYIRHLVCSDNSIIHVFDCQKSRTENTLGAQCHNTNGTPQEVHTNKTLKQELSKEKADATIKD